MGPSSPAPMQRTLSSALLRSPSFQKSPELRKSLSLRQIEAEKQRVRRASVLDTLQDKVFLSPEKIQERKEREERYEEPLSIQLYMEMLTTIDANPERTTEDLKQKALLLERLGCQFKEGLNMEESLSYYKRALALKKELHGESHRDVAKTISYIGTLFGSNGKLTDALRVHKQAWDMRIRELGADHVLTRKSEDNVDSCRRRIAHTIELEAHQCVEDELHDTAIRKFQMALDLRMEVWRGDENHWEVSLGHFFILPLVSCFSIALPLTFLIIFSVLPALTHLHSITFTFQLFIFSNSTFTT